MNSCYFQNGNIEPISFHLVAKIEADSTGNPNQLRSAIAQQDDDHSVQRVFITSAERTRLTKCGGKTLFQSAQRKPVQLAGQVARVLKQKQLANSVICFGFGPAVASGIASFERYPFD